MQERGLIVREPNPADGRSAMICLLPAGRRAIKDAAPQLSAYDLTCRSAYELTCWFAGSLAG